MTRFIHSRFNEETDRDLHINERDPEIGKELVLFTGWMIVQSAVIIILEGLHLLPGDLLGIELEYGFTPACPIDTYTFACGLVGSVYTAVGCIIMSLHEINSRGWWLRMTGWYLAYLPLTFLLFYFEIGWRVADVWFAPVLWVCEIELVNHIQKRAARSHLPRKQITNSNNKE